ncbi:methyltransferase domain-containing protein [Hydrogenophaga sp. D2P1]|uniref:Methyltransferase domain-containing protein n=2 Tax=Hydrogenophaga aromaticivorans TaxID=2610898 RepID=A0A7Y8H031_9BURK|nr:methyltransferase domain-containing protein [Hydrogenophaga aromaticivorans]
MSTRKELILRDIDTRGLGLEIGPSHNPVAPKRDGFQVHVMDHLTREGLVEKYKDHGVQLDNIEEVDFVWSGQSFKELTGGTCQYDWIIASHVIEHTPDLIAFLNECESILKPGGVLSLAVPDKRYCFDRFRPVTGLGKIIDAHLAKDTIHSPGNVAEYYMNVVAKDGRIAWSGNEPGDYRFLHGLSNASCGIQIVREQRAYLDIHAWCFVPHSFRLLVQDLHALKFIHLQECTFLPTVGHEFFMTLSKRAAFPEATRMELVLAAEKDLLG